MTDFKAEDYRTANPSPEPARDYSPAQVTHARANSGVVSVLSSNERKGRWELPRHFRALAVLGNVELDLREAEIGYGLSVIEAVAVLGNIEVTIPPNITVECDGDSLMGNFTLKYEGTSPTYATTDRVVRVTGTAYAGSVSVAVKGPNRKMLERLARTFGMERD